MPIASEWQLLPSSKPNKPLLVRTSFDKASYAVDVTDLTNIWSESLDRDQVVARAKDVSSDIHPEDDASQMRILLDKIESAFQDGEGTTLFVRPMSDRLDIFMTVPLPGGLNDLQWSMNLKKQPSSTLQSEILNPLISLSYLQKTQIEQLSGLLNEKDAAMSKVLDKVESLGLDYGTVFPNARLNRKHNLRDQVLRQVKGMAVFDADKWLSDSRASELGEICPAKAIPQALAGIASSSVMSMSHFSPVAGGGAVSPMPPRRRENVVVERTQAKPTPAAASQSQADEFQVLFLTCKLLISY